MNWLEKKIPPPLAASLIAVLMWVINSWSTNPKTGLSPIHWFLIVVLLAIGICIDLAGLIAFRRAKTTINPMTPEKTRSLVTQGIYQITRNPMYVGLCFFLLAWCVYLQSAWSILGVMIFILYINRFQIAAEERALETHFGDAYREYKNSVPRWLFRF